jgi:hypothetical protein
MKSITPLRHRSQQGHRRARASSLGLAALTLALAATSATAGSIGLKLGINANGGLQSAATGALLPEEIAGAPGYAQANWNVLGRWGDSGGNTLFTVLDSTGVATPVIVNWDANNIWSMAGGGTPTAQGTPDGNLMNSYDDSNGAANTTLANTVYGNPVANKPLVYISGLSAWLSAQSATHYDVVVYSDGDAQSGRVGEYWLVDASGPTSGLTYGADLTTHAFVCDRANFVTTLTYAEVPATVNGGQLSQRGNFQGNYTVFPSLQSDSFLLRTAEFNTRAQINAIQLVPRATPLPAMIDPLAPAKVFAGKTAMFRATVAGVTPMAFQWLKGTTPLADGGNLAGTTTATLTLNNVSVGDVASYALVVSNAVGVITSAPAALSLESVPANSYAQAAVNLNPVAYWRFDDTTSDPGSNYGAAPDAIGGFNCTYGNAAQNAYYFVAGPRPSDFPGFAADNYALQSGRNVARSWAFGPPLALNTNTVTVCGWIYPTAAQTALTAILSARGTGSDVFALGYANNANNMLGYTWTNAAVTYNYVSGLVPLTNAWSFIALVVDPDKAVLYLYNANGQTSATNTMPHLVAAFGGLTCIGTDPSSTTTPQDRAFSGSIDEVSVFNQALSQAQIYDLYKKGLGLTAIPPVISREPRSQGLYAGRTANFSVLASGDQPLSYRWREGGSNLADTGNITGSATPNLTLAGVAVGDSGDYEVVVENLAGRATSIVATLTVVVSNSTPVAYEAKLRELNPISYWRLDEDTGTLAYDYWGGNIATHENVTVGVAGPRPPEFVGLETTNNAADYNGVNSGTTTGTSYCNNLNQFAIVGWFNALGPLPARAGLFGQNDVTEFGFHGDAADLGIWTPAGAAFLPQSHIIPGVWYLVAGVGTPTNINLYLVSTGGVVQASTPITAATFGSSAYAFNIGGLGVLDATGNPFPGQIDEVAFFNRALSVGELSDLFGAALVGGALPPAISVQPGSTTVYAGVNVQLPASAVGTQPLGYQWRKGGVPISDAGNVSGTTTPTLVLTSVAADNQGDYDLVVSNSAGMATSQVATVTVITPEPGSFAAGMIGLNPHAYYRLNEMTDPASGTAVAYDYSGGHDGLYAVAALNGYNGIAGPTNPPFYGFESGNAALQITAATANSYATAPIGSLSTNTVTLSMWIYPMGDQVDWAGLLVNRNSGVAGGFGYSIGDQLGYTWNNNNANTYNFASGLVPPANEWSFVAVVVTPTNAIIYMFNSAGEFSATNTVAHSADVFGNNWRIGHDNHDNNENRTFNGIIDEVGVFTHSLSPSQLQQLAYSGGMPQAVSMSITPTGTNTVLLTWTGSSPSYNVQTKTNLTADPFWNNVLTTSGNVAVLPASAETQFIQVVGFTGGSQDCVLQTADCTTGQLGSAITLKDGWSYYGCMWDGNAVVQVRVICINGVLTPF